jgi:hypothetical protein
MISPLPPDDQRHVDAADGWLRLGNHVEAVRELEEVAPENQTHPEVLQAHWAACAKAEVWDRCLEMAVVLTETVPEQRFGWLHRAQSLRKLGRISAAKEVLQSVLDRFDPDCTFRFQLACYSAQLGQVQEARTWLRGAIEAAGDEEGLRRLKVRALDEPGLEPLWWEIAEP